MTKQNLKDTMKDFPSSDSGSQWFKFQEGDNELRVLTPFHVFAEHYSQGGYKGVCIGAEENCEGCKEGTKASPKWLAWIAQGEDLKLAKWGYRIIQQLSEYQDDPAYAFEDFPMPYNVNIKARNAGTTDVVYTVMPRQKEDIAPELLESLSKEHSPEQIVEAMKEKKRGSAPEKVTTSNTNYPSNTQEGITPDDIPF